MQFYDLLMLAVMGGAIFFGFWKGFAWQVASLAAIFVSYFVARNFNEPVANMIGGDPGWNRFLAMFILFMGTSLLIWLGFGFVKNSIERMQLKGFDRQIGALLGAGKGVILCTLITLFSVSLLGESTCQSICTSRSGNYIARVLGELGGLVPEEIGKYINPYIDKFQTEMEEHKNETQPTQPNGYLPDPGQQPPAGGGYRPNLPNQWNTNPDMTQGNTTSNERVGYLQPIPGGNQTGQQPVYNGTTGQWEYPNQYPPQQPQAGNGGYQPPNTTLPASWQDTARDAVQGAAEKALQEAWRRAMEGNR